MPAGNGYLDPYGIWRFGEDDDEGDQSGTLNLLAESVSEVIQEHDFRIAKAESQGGFGGIVTASSLFSIPLQGWASYEVTIDLPTASTANEISARLMSGGVPAGSSVYDRMVSLFVTPTTTTVAEVLDQPSWSLASNVRTDRIYTLRLHRVNVAARTMGRCTIDGWNATGGGVGSSTVLRHRTAAAYDALEIAVSTGTVTGTWWVRPLR